MNIVRIKRANGMIEERDITAKFPIITQATYDKLVAINAAAGSEILGFVEGGISKPVAVDAASFARSRRTIGAILGGSRDENDDTSASAMRGGF